MIVWQIIVTHNKGQVFFIYSFKSVVTDCYVAFPSYTLLDPSKCVMPPAVRYIQLDQFFLLLHPRKGSHPVYLSLFRSGQIILESLRRLCS